MLDEEAQTLKLLADYAQTAEQLTNIAEFSCQLLQFSEAAKATLSHHQQAVATNSHLSIEEARHKLNKVLAQQRQHLQKLKEHVMNTLGQRFQQIGKILDQLRKGRRSLCMHVGFPVYFLTPVAIQEL